MPRCSASKPDGSPCERIVKASQEYCFAHDPSRAEARRRAASRGGKAKAAGEIGQIKARLQSLADMVEEGQMLRADAAVISQIWGVYLRAISTELKVKEVTELEERLEALEAGLEVQKGGRGYGA
jgi:hypothetical protein